MRVTVTYDYVKARAERSGKCTICGRRSRRSQVFSETVSPFNRNAEGEVKTWDEVRDSVEAKAAAWAPQGAFFDHYTCRSDEH